MLNSLYLQYFFFLHNDFYGRKYSKHFKVLPVVTIKEWDFKIQPSVRKDKKTVNLSPGKPYTHSVKDAIAQSVLEILFFNCLWHKIVRYA